MYKIYVNGITEKKCVGEIETKEEAMDMCYKHNKTLPKEYMIACIGNMFFREV